jgi:hypothetical protein
MKVRFDVLTAVSMNIAVFWVVAPCSLVEVYQTTRCYNPEDSNLQPNERFIFLKLQPYKGSRPHNERQLSYSHLANSHDFRVIK